MKALFFSILFLGVCMPAYSSDIELERYIISFDYAARKEMKMDSKDLIKLLKQGKAQLIDIRFPEEYSAWKVGPAINIPLNELPSRLTEINKHKIIVTASLTRTVQLLLWFIFAQKVLRQNI